TAAPSATINYVGNPFCSSAGTASVTRTGTAGGTYSASPAGLTLNSSTGAVTLGTSTAGTYTVTYTIAAAGGCAQFTTTTPITVTAAPSATINYTGSPYCTSGGTATVTQTGTGGGSYSAAPAGLSINSSTGAVTLGTSTAGTYTVTYTIAAAGGCAQFTTTTPITVTAAPNATINYAGSPYCTTGGTATVTQTGTAGGSYSASPAGLSLNSSTGAVTLGTSTPGTYTVTYTIAAGGGCGVFNTTAQITVSSGFSATINYAGSPYCTNGGTATVTQTGTGGGSYSALPAGLTINSSTGAVTLGTSTPGTYTVTYTIAASGGCLQFTTNASITVTAAPNATISYAGSPFCSTGGTGSVTQTGTGGGSYSAAPAGLSINSSTGAITPTTSTPGTYTVTYTITAAGGCLQFTTTTPVTVTAAPTATISYAGSPFCSTGGIGSVTQTGTGGGSYSAAPAGLSINSSTGAITPTTSTPGTYTVTYTIAATGGCLQFTTTTPVTVTAAPSATINYTGSPYCTTGGTATVTQTGTSGGTYSASPAGLTINPGTGAVTLGSSTPGTYTVSYTIAAGGGCSVFSTNTPITVSAGFSATINYAGSPYCSNGGTATVTQTGTAGGTYSATPAGLTLNSSNGSVTLGTSTPGTYTVTYSIAASGGCSAFNTTTPITITAAPNATINYAGSPYCSNGGTATVTQTGTGGGAYSALPAGLTINSSTGAVTLGSSTPGTYTVTYTIAAAGGCSLFAITTPITVTAQPAATISYTGSPYCTSAGTATVTQTGTVGGSYSASPAGLTINSTTGAVTLGTSTPGTYTVTYTIAAAGGCGQVTATAPITVTAAPSATINYAGSPYCTTGGTATVTQTGTAGGAYSATPAGLTLSSSTGAVTLGTSTPGTYTVTYTIAPGGGCGVFNTTANITVAGAPVATAGGAQNICENGTTAGLGGNTPSAGSGSWSIVGGGNGNFIPNATTPNATFQHTSGTGPILLRWTVTNPPCSPATADVTVTITPSVQANAGSNQSICSTPGTATMAANAAAPGTGSWTQTGGPITANIAAPGSPTTQITGMTTNGVYTFRWTITNAPCPSNFSEMTVTVSSSATWYEDADGDGAGDPNSFVLACTAPPGYVSNSNDLCPADPNKINPGQCGCGVPDTDTDGDGVANCNDGCPFDPNKIAPGICGCGVPDTDTDADGTPDCNDGCPNDPNKIAPGLCGCGVPDTDTDGDGTPDCNDGCPNDPNKIAPGVCGCGVPDTDTDGDGTPDCNDQCPNDPNKVTPGTCGCGNPEPGALCDDGDVNTIGDVIQPNCTCAGIPLGTDCEGVPGGPAVPGTACNDNNPCTINDIYDANCICSGTFQDSDGDGTCDAFDLCPGGPEPGTPCNDFDPCTINDVIGANCLCEGTFQDSDGDGTCDADDLCPGGPEPGTACDDGDACTENDVIDLNCNCVGVFQDSDGDGTCDAEDVCPGGPEPGTPCDDFDPNTNFDVIQPDCTCAGIPAGNDCLGVPGGSALPGTPCDDLDPTTGSDTWDLSCTCVGQPLDCLGVPGGTAVPGTPCTDGDPTTGNDTWDPSCTCVGQPLDCLNVPGGTALPGTPCNDGNPGTINDTWSASCTCVGIPTGCTENLSLAITLDAFGSQTTWELKDATGTVIVASGGPYANGTPGAVINETICVSVGCYRLFVYDSGNNGITNGGYVLRDPLNRRILDANGLFTSVSTAVNEFCLPLSNQGLQAVSCDRTDLVPTSNIYCSSQPGATGYQFWFFDPHGSYNRRILWPNTTIKPNQLVTNPIPLGLDLNVRVRAQVGGVYGAFGPACRMRVNPPGSPNALVEGEVNFTVYPNPNRGENVQIMLEGVDETIESAVIDVYDLFGKRIHTEQVAMGGGVLNHVMEFGNDLAQGMYIVHVTVGEQVHMQRLVRQ
ncbi:MAG: T9SS type A sorting domain-containing protein, partial [Flavobacteriales bacterium]|nr:T9SS type A sorting domain-containing protein [Flavobacteriales bacterium]